MREFIRENIGMMFGLDRFVSMNALADMITGPHPADVPEPEYEPVSSYEIARAWKPETPSVTDYLSSDEPDDQLEPGDE